MRPKFIMAAVICAMFLFLSIPSPVQAWLEPGILAASDSKEPGREGNKNLPEPAELAFETARRTLNLQTELPHPDPRQMRVRRTQGQPLNFPEGLAKAILLIAVAAVVAVILLAIRDHFKGRPPQLEEPSAVVNESSQEEVAARMAQARDSADDLAQAGEYTQAMHVLLLQSVTELRRRLAVSIASSLTSREILARTKLNPQARAAFADIIGRVEISYFGFHQPALEDYLACRSSFEHLKQNLVPGAAA